MVARVFLRDGTDLGVVHLPPPIQPGDLCSLDDGLPLRIMSVAPTLPDSPFDALLEVLWERRQLFRRGDNSVPRRSAPSDSSS